MTSLPIPSRPESQRVHAFFDGQNLFGGARDCFGYKYPNYDPVKLAQSVTNMIPGRILSKVHFYTGIHRVRENPTWHYFWANKLRGMRNRGVIVTTRYLKYTHFPITLDTGEQRIIKQGREKGIDLRLGLDLVRLARKKEYDVAIIFSQDTDLEEAVNEVYDIREEFNLWINLECAFPVSPIAKNTRGISHTRWRMIDKARYDACLDTKDHRP